jgi:hypothetical protein
LQALAAALDYADGQIGTACQAEGFSWRQIS